MIENEDDSQSPQKESNSATKKVEASNLAKNPSALETTREYRSKYNLEDTLDISEMAEKAAA